MDARTEAMPSSRLQISESNPSTLFPDRVFTTSLPIQNPSTGMYLEASESQKKEKETIALEPVGAVAVVIQGNEKDTWTNNKEGGGLLRVSYVGGRS